jgi:hypothetical protein
VTTRQDLARAYRELRKGFPDVPAHVLMSWARTRVEILDYVAADYDSDGVYCMTVTLPDPDTMGSLDTVWIYSEPDVDDCAFGDECENHDHLCLFARIYERAGSTVVASTCSVCSTGDVNEYEYHASLALELAREAHATCDEWATVGLS